MSRFLKLHGLALLVGLAGLLLSLGAFWVIRAELEARHQLEFEWLAHNRNRVLKKGIEERLDAVRSLHDLFRVSEAVDGRAFGLFARSLFDRYQGIQALAWVPRPPDGFPIHYLESERDSGLQVGQDLGENPVLRALMGRALASGDMVVSGRIPLITGENPQYGFMAFMPVFRPMTPGATDRERQAYQQGQSMELQKPRHGCPPRLDFGE